MSVRVRTLKGELSFSSLHTIPTLTLKKKNYLNPELQHVTELAGSGWVKVREELSCTHFANEGTYSTQGHRSSIVSDARAMTDGLLRLRKYERVCVLVRVRTREREC